MKRLFAVKDLALAADQTAIVDGQLALFVELKDGTNAYWATGQAVKRFMLMYGRGVDKLGNVNIITSPWIDARPRHKLLKKGAAVAAVIDAVKARITAKGDSTMGSSQQDEFVLNVDLRGGPNLFGNESQTRTYISLGQFATEQALYDDLALKVNSSEYGDLVATSSSTGITIQPTTAYAEASLFVTITHTPYSVNVVPQAASYTQVSTFTPGSGTVADLLRQDREQMPSLGIFYVNDTDYKVPVALTLSGTYQTLYMYFQNRDHTTDMQAHGNEVYADITVCYPTGVTTNLNAFQAAIEEIVADTFVTTVAA